MVRLEHNFSRGLDGWYGGREWARTWVREPNSGFVRVGELALYRPAQPFTDYSFEFLGQIDGKSMSWVYRAADLQNYYVTTLLVERPGPVPAMVLEHYKVIGGQQSKHERVPVRMVLHNGRPYRIQQDVVGNGFTTYIEGEMVDFWTDDRLPSGTVGFLGEKGSAPHLYWMKVTYQDDFWGKLLRDDCPQVIDFEKRGGIMSPRKPIGNGPELRPVEFSPRTESPKASRYIARAVSLHLDGKAEEALRELQRAVAKGEKSAEVYSAMGQVQFELGQFEGAANSYRELLQLEPDHPMGWFNLAVCLERTGRWQEASEKFQKAAQVDPARTEAQLGLGICLLHLNQAQPALAAFERVLAREAENETAVVRQGRRAAARHALRRSLRAVPEASSKPTRTPRNRSPT